MIHTFRNTALEIFTNNVFTQYTTILQTCCTMIKVQKKKCRNAPLPKNKMSHEAAELKWDAMSSDIHKHMQTWASSGKGLCYHRRITADAPVVSDIQRLSCVCLFITKQGWGEDSDSEVLPVWAEGSEGGCPAPCKLKEEPHTYSLSTAEGRHMGRSQACWPVILTVGELHV